MHVKIQHSGKISTTVAR